MFSRDFRTNGVNPMSIYLRTYKVGDFVDIKVNPSIQKGMPFKAYHGRTGVVFNVSKRALGVRVNKRVNGRIINKRIHVRVEHAKPSKCQMEIKQRVKANESAKAAVRKSKGEKVSLKRLPTQPKKGYVLEMNGTKPDNIQALPFVDLV